jgi:hypothetical protein
MGGLFYLQTLGYAWQISQDFWPSFYHFDLLLHPQNKKSFIEADKSHSIGNLYTQTGEAVGCYQYTATSTRFLIGRATGTCPYQWKIPNNIIYTRSVFCSFL